MVASSDEPMTKAAVLAKFERLKALAEEAYAAQKGDNRTPETMQAAVAASRALSEFMAEHPGLRPKMSHNKFSNQAGQRQYNARPERATDKLARRKD